MANTPQSAMWTRIMEIAATPEFKEKYGLSVGGDIGVYGFSTKGYTLRLELKGSGLLARIENLKQTRVPETT